MTDRAVADLRDAMEHLVYELWMLAETSRRIRAAQRDADTVATNAYLESMLFHVRALSDFFVLTKRGFSSTFDALTSEATIGNQVQPTPLRVSEPTRP